MSIRTESITRILRIKGELPDETTVWLKATTDGKPFKCVTCGKTQFHRQHRVIALINDDASYNLQVPPLSVQCPSCGHIYHVQIL